MCRPTWAGAQGRSPRSTARFLSCLRGFYRYQLREGRISADPSLDVESPRLGRPLPKSLSEGRGRGPAGGAGSRGPAGVSRSHHAGAAVRLRPAGLELVGLQVVQLGLNQGVVRIIGKGGKERLVPMGEEALAWLQRFLTAAAGVAG